MKNAGLTYVNEFSFSKEQGFTGSAGVHHVRGYSRGGQVKRSHGGTVGVTTTQSKSMKGKAAQGAAAKKSVKKAHGGSMHDQLYAEGDKMGYMRGGQVKETSGEFDMKSEAQDSMDSGVQPARKGRNQASIEAGGTKRLKPKFKKGGGVHKVRMPKRGGLAKYASGGSVPPSVGHLGSGLAASAASKAIEREERVKSTVSEAVAAHKASMHGGTSTHDKAPTRAKPTAGKKAAPGSGRGKRPHYGLPFKSTPMVK